MMSWHLETRKLKDLKPHSKNPRRLSKHDAKHLEKSLTKFGLVDKPIINPDGTIIGGHQRISILKKLKQKEVECFVPDAPLSQDEQDELCIRLNRNVGEWDMDILANRWDMGDLLELGFVSDEFGSFEGEIDAAEVSLPNIEKPLVQMTFTVSTEQQEEINRAVGIAKSMGDFGDTGNENSNGNGLARVCELWITQNGKSERNSGQKHSQQAS